ncbi:hypothetical protein MARI151_20299 [Maribacter litoralis]|uniref:Uncharacterized protein n=1 Tax=Maribacter litoralis TaxID=2059726 RepID=A0A653PNK3_9FLAO|nr:hypothetical protein MARI151_20299 [Maribacter litoralis]
MKKQAPANQANQTYPLITDNSFVINQSKREPCSETILKLLGEVLKRIRYLPPLKLVALLLV